MSSIIDLVKWEASGEQLYAWKFPYYNLSTYTQLLVAESQEAILFSKGQIIGKFGSGKHTLNTENLPILRNLYGIPFGGKNPFTAEVWFVNKLIPLNIDWTTDSMIYNDPDYQTMVPLVAKGRYGVKIIDAERFLIKLVGTATSFNSKQLTDNFWGATVSKTKSVLLQFILSNNIGIKKISAYLDPLSENLRLSITPFWEDYGLQLISFYITSCEVDASSDSGAKILDAMSRQSAQAIGGYTWQQSKAFEVADKAVDNLGGASGPGGLLGAVLATNMMSGGGASGMLQPPANSSQQQGQSGLPNSVSGINAPKIVYCDNCGGKYTNDMKFCPHCGDPYTACPRCGADNDVNAKKCVSCGAVLSASAPTCSNCNAPLVEGSTFCANCGKPIGTKEGKCQRCGSKLNNTKFCPQCGFKNS